MNNEYSDDLFSEIEDSFGQASDIAAADENDFQPIPEGWHTAEIDQIEVKRAKSGNVGMSLTFRILSDLAPGRLHFHWLNAAHPEPKVRAMAAKDWARVVRAAGLDECPARECAKLLGKIIQIKLAARKDDASERRIVAYSPIEGAGYGADDDDLPF